MTRQFIDYAQPGSGRAVSVEALTDELRAGFYRVRRGAKSVWRPVCIWHGPPLDPDTGETLDRSPRWQVMFCGRLIWDHSLVWPQAAGQPITREEHDYLLERIEYAREHDPNDPFGTKSGHVDWLNSTPPF